MSEKQFTLEEARELVPWLQETFDGLAPLRDRMQRLNKETDDMVDRTRSNGGSDAEERLELSRRALSEISEALADGLRPVLERGMVVRSADRALVDFPSMREGRQVYLCWIDGEKDIEFWHELDTGFAGRQPL
jgi:hypothetical protein